MSFSFNVQAETKDAAKAGIAAKMDEVVAGQPSHVKDRDAVVATAGLYVDMLVETIPVEERISVNVQGSLGWREEGVFNSAHLSVSASVISA